MSKTSIIEKRCKFLRHLITLHDEDLLEEAKHSNGITEGIPLKSISSNEFQAILMNKNDISLVFSLLKRLYRCSSNSCKNIYNTYHVLYAFFNTIYRTSRRQPNSVDH